MYMGISLEDSFDPFDPAGGTRAVAWDLDLFDVALVVLAVATLFGEGIVFVECVNRISMLYRVTRPGAAPGTVTPSPRATSSLSTAALPLA
jgi:hypothetical protein